MNTFTVLLMKQKVELSTICPLPSFINGQLLPPALKCYTGLNVIWAVIKRMFCKI